MKQHFICLANSIKYQGRCVAGIEIVFDDTGNYRIVKNEVGTPKWIRPISPKIYGALPERATKNIALLDILEIDNVKHCPNYAHSEDVFYSSLKNSGKKVVRDASHLNELCDTVHPSLFFNRGKAISAEVFQQSNYSLMFICASDCVFYKDESDFFKPKFRIRFFYNACEYDLPITDPVFLDKLKAKGLDSLDAKHYYLTVSLSEDYKGWHYKLVAGVVEIQDS